MFNLGNWLEKILPNLKDWVRIHYFHLAVFNLILIILVLLRSAGYFQPFVPITIHTIILITLILLVFLLEVRSNFLFILTAILWFFAAFLRIVGIEVWAERTTVYAYEAIVIAVLLLILEGFKKDD